ncbi:MAG: DUF4271 domain-containing protein [Paludibacteraceae bacterium]|nr:DUF4271 domain-containing protein [Paludibacteraceae bacterium]
MTGHEGLPLHENFFHSDQVISFIWCFFLYVCFAYAVERRSTGGKRHFAPLFGTDNRHLTLREIIRRGLLLIFAVFGYSFFFTNLLKDGGHWQVIGISAGVFVSFLVFKYLLLSVYLATFFPKARTNFVSQYFTMILFFGLFLFLAFIGLQFMPQPVHLPILAIVAIGVLVLCGWLLYLFFKTFFNKSQYFFYFILYLCTLEILPLMIFFRELWKADIVTHILKL